MIIWIILHVHYIHPPEDSFEYQIQGIKCFMFRSFRWISGVLGFKMIILKLNKLNFKNGFSKLKKKNSILCYSVFKFLEKISINMIIIR